jgi:hypothetical protein
VRRNQAILVILAIAVLSSFAFDWPLNSGGFKYGFGAPRSGFLKGVEFGATPGMVRAVADGELTFVATGDHLPGGYPISGGSLISLAHPSDLISVYAGMAPDSISRYLIKVRAGDVLGRSADGGSAQGMHLFTYDGKERRFVNPLMVLPNLRDDAAPVIRAISVKNEGIESRLEQGRTIRQGTYDVIIEAYDLSPGGEPSAPFEMSLTMDGSVRARVVYDASWAKEGKAYLFGSTGLVESTYMLDGNRVRFGPYVFPRGRLVLSATVSDFVGNKREQTYSLSVQ